MRLRNLAFASLILLAGCATSPSDTAAPGGGSTSPSATPVPSPSAAGELPPVTVSRTGGLVGFEDKYTVSPDGTLSGSTREAPALSKKLTADQLSELHKLATSPSLAAEAAKMRSIERECVDGFNYSVAAGSVTATTTDCGRFAEQAPTMWKIVELVQSAAQK
jgi:hypothetical protein